MESRFFMQQSAENKFVVDLLTTLQQERFSLRAWRRFFLRSWLMSCQTARENPALTQSWGQVTILMLFLMAAILIGNGLIAGYADALRLLPGFVFCVLWQQSDLFWHLGLNRSTRSGELLQSIGSANTLTWLRGLGASYLLGRLLGGLTEPSELTLAVFLGGIITDILDGHIARITGKQSKLGQIADAEADFCLYLSLTIILLSKGILPLWVGIVMLLRFVVPLVAALLSYMALARPVRFGSTAWGKYAGLVQCCYFLLLLLPLPHFTFFPLLNGLLLIIMIGLLVIAPIAQLFANIKVLKRSVQEG
ncbi:MAG: CDP-alcohol phosphatidyltransferase family protein [Ktedonobacteraceae bacterium]|nr:CDP-alcohol phosphatidyltransferase family protein [Ktedonobacteraceae bacterium]